MAFSCILIFFHSLPQLTHFLHPFCSNLIHPFPSLASPSLLSYPVFYYLSTFTASPAILPPPLCFPFLRSAFHRLSLKCLIH